jgi:hypothetical protein
MALRAKRIIVRLEQDIVGFCHAWCRASFLRGSRWFSVFSVINSCLFFAPNDGLAMYNGEPRS